MKLKLPSSVSSAQDLTSLTLEIREYGRWFSHAAIKKNLKAGHVSEPPEISPAAMEMIHESAAKKPLSTDSLDELIRSLEDFKRKANTMTITLAAPPAGDMKKTLVQWCRDNIASDVLVTFQFNSTLLGGMVVRYGSRLLDMSFRRQILESRQHFPEVLRRV